MSTMAEMMQGLRIDLGMNQEDWGATFGYSKSSISNIENQKKEVPSHMIERAVENFKAFSLALEKCQGCKNNYFVPARVDIDNTPTEVLDVVIKEFEEGIEAAQLAKRELKLYNKRSREQLSDLEFQKLMDYTEQIYDPLVAIAKWLEVFARDFRGDIREIKSRNITKLYDNGAKTKKTLAPQQSVSINSY